MSGKLRSELEGVSLGEFENDWKRQLLVERGLEIISEASRNIDPGIKERHGTIPWRNIADIGNVLRHAYHKIEPSLTWQIVKDHLPDLQRVCEAELAAIPEVKREDGVSESWRVAFMDLKFIFCYQSGHMHQTYE